MHPRSARPASDPLIHGCEAIVRAMLAGMSGVRCASGFKLKRLMTVRFMLFVPFKWCLAAKTGLCQLSCGTCLTAQALLLSAADFVLAAMPAPLPAADSNSIFWHSAPILDRHDA
mgnify:CR=1 FL=1